MASTQTTSLADRGQRLGLRLIAKAGGLPGLKDKEVRARVEKYLYRGAVTGFKAQTAAGRAFARRKGSGSPARATKVGPKPLFDLTPSEDQQMLSGVARELAEEAIRPAAAQADTDRAVPEEVRSAAAEIGLHLIGVPAELEGIAEERSAVTASLVLEELARGDMGIAAAIMAPAAAATAIASYGDADQQATYLPEFTGENPPAAALALQEPQVLFDPFALQTKGVTEGDEVVLTGVKAIVPGAETADLFIVSAEIDGQPRLVIVKPGTEGVQVEDDPAMGVRAAGTARLHLEGARIPRSEILGTTEDHADAVRRARLAWAAAAVGTSQAVLDHVSEYVKERKAFGEPIGYRQAVAFTVSDIAIELAGLRLVVWKAAARLDRGDDATAEIAQARSLVARHATWIGSNGVQLLGGHGFVKEFDNERWYRDLRGAGVLEGMLLV
ncbi:acyl-CoA dehydrogenase family protein [Janibacter corallicola]|uniref:acyl-CoA dehydrogenase family protein n=1 Tax=Janibacter corallicola TaxID=415212 RepID=UPI00082B1E6D|nr:acyl-CoA dehydrogenase family protein [Janibacter corallicola]